jgi:hypothetical protein
MIISLLLVSVLATPPVIQPRTQLPIYMKAKNTIKNSTIDKLFKLCPKISEKHVMPKTLYNSSQIHLAKIKKCLGVEQLLVIGWHGNNSKLELTWAKLIALHYAAYVGEKEKSTFLIKYLSLKSKSANMSVSKHDPKPWFAFYKLYKEKKN